MAAYADLEIGLSRVEEKTYTVSLRFNAPDSDIEQRWPAEGDWRIVIDFQKFRELEPYMEQYGQLLHRSVLTEKIRPIINGEILAGSSGTILRVRLAIDPNAAELHNLHWEALRDPETNELVFAGSQLVLSRYLTSRDWTSVRSRPRSDLNALVVIANGSTQKLYGFSPVDLEAETKVVKTALGDKIQKTFLHETSSPRATLDNIVGHLPGYDILYLVCHGKLTKPDETDQRTWQPKLLLEKENGESVTVPAAEFVRQVQKLHERPRLIVLASCQSAGNAESRLSPDLQTIAVSVGPQLAQAGIPAVVAMRGNISMETSKKFMGAFFAALAEDGQIDRAVGVARNAVRHQNDFWMPVLFMRLRSGRVWYVPGFESGGFDHWKSICRFIHDKSFVPIIGSQMADAFLGSAQDLAAKLADDNRFPLSSLERTDTARVAQYVCHKTGVTDLQTSVREFWVSQLLKRYPELKSLEEDVPVIGEELARIQAADPDNPYTILAQLKQASVYVTATADPLLELALEQAGRRPAVIVPQWRDEGRDGPGKPEINEDPKLDPPLLYYAYGKYQGARNEEATWVLTEDDFFDYMIRASKYRLLSGTVAYSLCTKSLVFLGFPLDDWKFRIFFRMILALGGSDLITGGNAEERTKKINHVAVQVNPDETTLADANRARKYLEGYFKNASNIDFYWGTATDFLRQLRDQLASNPKQRSN